MASFLRLSIANKFCGRSQASWKRWSSTLAGFSSVAPGDCDSPADLILGQSLWFPTFFGHQKSEILTCFSKAARDSRYRVWDWKCQASLPQNRCKDHQHSSAREHMPLLHYNIICPVLYMHHPDAISCVLTICSSFPYLSSSPSAWHPSHKQLSSGQKELDGNHAIGLHWRWF